MNISKQSISETLVEFVRANILEPDVPFTAESILSKTGVDSYSVIEIVLFIERQYGVVIPDEQLIPANLNNINSIAACVFQLMKTK